MNCECVGVLRYCFKEALCYITEMIKGGRSLPPAPLLAVLFPTFIFHPLYSNILMEKKGGVEFVTCNYSPDDMLVLSLSIYKQYTHDDDDNNTTEFHESMHSNCPLH